MINFLSAAAIDGVQSIPDIPRIYTAIAEWAACTVFAFILKKRFTGVRFWALLISSLALMIGVQLIAGILPLYLWIPGMLAAMGAMYLSILVICKVKPKDALFWTARAFILAEFAASIKWQFYYYVSQNFLHNSGIVLEIIFLIVIYTVVFLAAYILERRYNKSNLKMDISNNNLFTVIAITFAIFLISNISFISRNTPLSGQFATDIFYIRTLVDLCGLILLYALQEQRLWMRTKIELDATQNILSRQYEQYRLSKDNIELINRRYHDLKYQIAIIKEESSPQKKAEYLEEMERGIKLHEAQNKTGNNVLDTLLTSKSLYCLENDINFTCVADGSLLEFMDIMDLCSIVGNALDNAFECVMKLKDKEKKIVKMAVYAQNEFLMIRFENYIETSPVFEDGLPVTTKSKRENHGYGIKSIKIATEKYNGSMKIGADGNWFNLCLLIPLEENYIKMKKNG